MLSPYTSNHTNLCQEEFCMVAVEDPTKQQTCWNLGWSLAQNWQHRPKLMQIVTMFHLSWIGLSFSQWSTVHEHISVAQVRQKHWLLYFMAIVGENHSLQISTRILSKAWPLTAVCLYVLGGRGGGAASSWFVLGGRGGGAASSWFVLGGRGGGTSLSLWCGSLLSSCLGDSCVSSAKNCCGGIGGGGEPSDPSGLLGRDVISTLMEGVPGGITTDLSKHTHAY